MSDHTKRIPWNENIIIAVLLLLLMGTFIFFHCIYAHYEKETFNKYKSADQPEATIWDALFSELRVETKGE